MVGRGDAARNDLLPRLQCLHHQHVGRSHGIIEWFTLNGVGVDGGRG